jgi:hypothetical protein
MATNYEMIEELAMMVGYDFDGTNLKTFQEWKKEGMKVKKGEKATMKLDLWKPFTVKVKDEEGNVEKDENGKDKTETRFKLVPSCLFSIEQVEKMDSKPAKAKKAPKKAKATKTAKKAPKKETEAPKEEVKEEVAEVKTVEEITSEIVDSKEVNEYHVDTAWFSRKPSTINEVISREFAECDRYVVVEELVLPASEFLILGNNLLSDYDFLKGKGGTRSTADLSEVPDDTPFYKLTPEQRERFDAGAYRACIRVTAEGSEDFALLVDPQGYSYGRYVAVEGL